MMYGTYKAPGYKYGMLLLRENGLLGSRIAQSLSKEDEMSNSYHSREGGVTFQESLPSSWIVPFESVDGLTLEELKEYPDLLYQGRYLAFVMYDSIPILRDGVVEEKTRSRYAYLIDTEKNKDCGIDEVLEDYFVKHINSLEMPVRKRALGFLEEYVCSTKHDVNNIIRNYGRQFVNLDGRLIMKK